MSAMMRATLSISDQKLFHAYQSTHLGATKANVVYHVSFQPSLAGIKVDGRH